MEKFCAQYHGVGLEDDRIFIMFFIHLLFTAPNKNHPHHFKEGILEAYCKVTGHHKGGYLDGFKKELRKHLVMDEDKVCATPESRYSKRESLEDDARGRIKNPLEDELSKVTAGGCHLLYTSIASHTSTISRPRHRQPPIPFRLQLHGKRSVPSNIDAGGYFKVLVQRCIRDAFNTLCNHLRKLWSGCQLPSFPMVVPAKNLLLRHSRILVLLYSGIIADYRLTVSSIPSITRQQPAIHAVIYIMVNRSPCRARAATRTTSFLNFQSSGLLAGSAFDRRLGYGGTGRTNHW
ncbi:uncharacterized protein RSE6_01985 [Rhynchosporium secalis]|uniref:Uncharacterized protein n=1 Tax=Rhynchosporium secalis TaxID=38038 RepID=A0A1E1LZ43_RHYSE|nr:uncharacterized protein RSE6_01985 [Rhynchosporium secalis]